MTGEAELDGLRRAAVRDARAAMAACHALSEAMDIAMRVAGELVEGLEHGECLVTAMRRRRAWETRMSATEAIHRYEVARRTSRARLVAVALAEGASDAEIQELWNVSAEIVRRIKRQIASMGPDDEGPSDGEGAGTPP